MVYLKKIMFQRTIFVDHLSFVVLITSDKLHDRIFLILSRTNNSIETFEAKARKNRRESGLP